MPVKLFECGFGDVQGTRVWQCFGAVNLISAVRCAGGSGALGCQIGNGHVLGPDLNDTHLHW